MVVVGRGGGINTTDIAGGYVLGRGYGRPGGCGLGLSLLGNTTPRGGILREGEEGGEGF